MGLGSRIWTGVTTVVVRKVVPVLVNIFASLAQLLVIMTAGCLILVGVYIADHQGIPERVIKSAAIFLGLIPMGFALLVVGEQVRLTYTKPKEIVYPDVEAFPDREPT
jgi:hypothetical protein